MEAAELLDLICREIDRLPRQRRLVLVLSYLSGMTNTEIATRLGISEKSVSNQKTLALKTLKLKLNKMKVVSMPILVAARHFCYPPTSFSNVLVKFVDTPIPGKTTYLLRKPHWECISKYLINASYTISLSS